MSATKESLNVKIVGAGIAGLATALSLVKIPNRHQILYNITVLESSSALSTFGAGIGLSANAIRILHALGLYEAFAAVSNKATLIQFIRYEDDRVLGERHPNPASEWEYGYPAFNGYRPDIQRLLAEAIENENAKAGRQVIKILFNQRVTAVDPQTGSITYADGCTDSADLVIAADGLRGKLREFIPGNEGIKAKAFQEFCFRAAVPRERMEAAYPETRDLIQNGGLSIAWLGSGVCMLGYPVHAGELYNIVIATPREVDEDQVGKWSEPGDIKEGAELLKSFNSRCQKVWSLVTECIKWTIGYLPALETFASESGRLCVIGDAAHAVLPHSGQGGCQALEDASSLATCLSYMASASQLPTTLSRWNGLRQTRMGYIRRYGTNRQAMMTAPDGPAQEKRDAALTAMTQEWKDELARLGPEGMKTKPKAEADPEKDDMHFSSPHTTMYVYGYDAIQEARKVMEE